MRGVAAIGMGGAGRKAALGFSEVCRGVRPYFGKGTTAQFIKTGRGKSGWTTSPKNIAFPVDGDGLEESIGRLLSAGSAADMEELLKSVGELYIVGMWEEICLSEVLRVAAAAKARGVKAHGVIGRLTNNIMLQKLKGAEQPFFNIHIVTPAQIEKTKITNGRPDAVQASSVVALMLRCEEIYTK